MLNNRGQSLVLFVLVIPIILIVMMLVIDIGRIILLKQELNNINYIAIDYGIDIMNEDGATDKIRELIEKNKSQINKIEITINDDNIYITLEDNVDFWLYKNDDFITVKTSYIGCIKDDEKIIERNK